MSECIEDEYANAYFSDEYLQLMHEEYRRRKIRYALIGPIVSTLFHVGLIVILSIMSMLKKQ